MFFYDTEIETPKQYDMIKFVPYLRDFYDILQSYFVEKLKSLPYDGKYMVRNSSQDPQLVSFDIYQDTQYWWLLMLYNDLTMLDEIKPGKIFLYPGTKRYGELYFDLRTNETILGYYVEE